MTYEDRVTLVGQVQAVDLGTNTFVLKTEDGRTVQGTFTPEQQSAITQALHEHDSQRLRVEGTAEVEDPPGRVTRLVEVQEVDVIAPTPPDLPSPLPLLMRIRDLAREYSQKDMGRLPRDGAINYRHYLYGHEKQKAAPVPGEPPLLVRLLELTENYTDEDLKGLPADAAANLDHYLYGSPKEGK